MFVGESWGTQERIDQMALVGRSGKEFDKILPECGLKREDVFCTNVIAEQPLNNDMYNFFYPTKEARKEGHPLIRGLYPKENIIEGLVKLYIQIAMVNPKIIVGMGNYALWALTEDSFNVGDDHYRKVPTGILAWRGSQMYCRKDIQAGAGRIPLMPIIHPAAALRQWSYRYTIKHDLKSRLPKVFTGWDDPTERKFIIRPTYAQVMEYFAKINTELNIGPTDLSTDIETRNEHIACVGLALTINEAICIPFMDAAKPEGYWQPIQEWYIISELRRILEHPNCTIIGQNFHFDAQYIHKYWLCDIKKVWDTMPAQDLCWP